MCYRAAPVLSLQVIHTSVCAHLTLPTTEQCYKISLSAVNWMMLWFTLEPLVSIHSFHIYTFLLCLFSRHWFQGEFILITLLYFHHFLFIWGFFFLIFFFFFKWEIQPAFAVVCLALRVNELWSVPSMGASSPSSSSASFLSLFALSEACADDCAHAHARTHTLTHSHTDRRGQSYRGSVVLEVGQHKIVVCKLLWSERGSLKDNSK